MSDFTNNLNTSSYEGFIEKETDHFFALRFSAAVGKGVKANIKSIGCFYSYVFQAWLCPPLKLEEVKKVIACANLECYPHPVKIPKGIVSSDSQINGRETRLAILESTVFTEEKLFLMDVYRYSKDLRPEDFSEAPIEESKSSIQFKIEYDFHLRWKALQKHKEEIQQLRLDLASLNEDIGIKIFDKDEPLVIVDELIKAHFLYQDIRTIHYCLDSFWQWDGKKYQEVSTVEMRQTIYDFLRDAKTQTKSDRKKFNPNKQKVDCVIDALKSVCFQKYCPTNGPIWLAQRQDPNPKNLICFLNGILDLEKWVDNQSIALLSHTPLLLNTNVLPFEFIANPSSPLTWINFINSLWLDDLESQQTLQEWMGYVLTQDTRFQKILLLIGPPRSGKGTIARILRKLLGAHNVSGPTLSSLSGEFGLQPLLNMMLAIISDARLNSSNNNSVIVERLLSISGEDLLTVNRKFVSPINVQLATRLMILTNEIPEIYDVSGALASRFIILSLKKSWLNEENTNLLANLQQEISGILFWALEGLIRLHKRGHFLQPQTSTLILEELETVSSPIRAFVKESCILDAKKIISIQDLYKAWCEWCAVMGYGKLGNVQSFGKNIRTAYPQITPFRPNKDLLTRGPRCYLGIGLLSG